MSSQQSTGPPASTRGNVYFNDQAGQPNPAVNRREQGTKYANLPPPSSSDVFRPPLANPPSHLDPPFAPQSPKLRPHFSDITPRLGGYGQTSQRTGTRPWATSIPPAPAAAPPVSGTSLPPIYPRPVSHHSSISGTNPEPTSPLEAPPHEQQGRSAPFDDPTYTTTPFRGESGPHPQQSPTNSYQSSIASSAGQQSSSALHSQSSAPVGLTQAPIKSEGGREEMTDRYILIVRQQPLAARACGFGERDRRVLDPPAVVQLSFKDYDPSLASDVAELQYPFHIVHCSLFTVPPDHEEERPGADVTSVPDPGKVNALCRRLMGTLVASPFVAVDPEAPASDNENARLGCFFIFPDLSIRQTGKYRLRFTLMRVPIENMIEGGQSTVAASVDSDIFEVYVAGHFPGMSPSSLLIKELKRQGAAVSLKKGAPSRQKRAGKDSDGSGDDGSEVGVTSSTKSRQKKKRG